MKKFLRILAVALIVSMLCTSVALAAPKRLSAIEGLPEIPENIPEMKTKNDGVTQTVTLSEPLSWLCAIRNWEWIPVTFDETGLVGTVEIDPNLSLGFAKGNWFASWKYDGPIGYWDYNYGVWVNDGEDADEAIAAAKEALLEDFELDQKEYHFNADLYVQNEETGEWEYAGEDPHAITYWGKEYILVEEIPQPENGGTWYNIVPAYDEHTYCYDTYAMKDFGMAYEGETKDGIKVRFDSHGKLMQMVQTLTGVNFLGSEEAPTKTEVTFEWQDFEKDGKKTGRWVIRSIKEYYADETFSHIQYSYNGEYEKTLHE